MKKTQPDNGPKQDWTEPWLEFQEEGWYYWMPGNYKSALFKTKELARQALLEETTKSSQWK